jgi:hypothetical protein
MTAHFCQPMHGYTFLETSDPEKQTNREEPLEVQGNVGGHGRNTSP